MDPKFLNVYSAVIKRYQEDSISEEISDRVLADSMEEAIDRATELAELSNLGLYEIISVKLEFSVFVGLEEETVEQEVYPDNAEPMGLPYIGEYTLYNSSIFDGPLPEGWEKK